MTVCTVCTVLTKLYSQCTIQSVQYSQLRGMAKRTVKYVKASELGQLLGMPTGNNQEALYSSLNDAGYFWDSNTQQWQQSNEPADSPTDLVRVRVWTNTAKVRGAAHHIKGVMEEAGFELLEQSEPYACRPPKQLESRIYLTFRQRD